MIRGPFHPLFVRRHWAELAPKIQRILDHEQDTGMTLEGVFRDIQAGHFQTWITESGSALMLTLMRERQDGTMLFSINMAGGEDLIEHRDKILPIMEGYARMHGCIGVEITGRKGWEKVAKPCGYEPFYVGVLKKL